MLNRKNKKGFVFSLAMLIIPLVLGLILVGAFIFSKTLRWVLIGIGLFIGAIYIIASVKNTRFKVIFSLVLVIVAIGFIVGSGVLQQAVQSRVYLPEYASIWCGVCDTGEETKTFSIEDERVRIYKCTDGYIPKGCNLEVEFPGGIGEKGAYLCSKSVDRNIIIQELKNEITFGKSGGNIQNCVKYGDNYFGADVTKDFNLNQNQYFYVVSEEHPARIKMDYEPFCLRTLERGQLSSYSSCSKTELLKNVKDAPLSIPDILPSGRENSIENIVIGYSEVVNPVDVVNDNTYLRLQFGEIQSCNIKTGNDGNKYVDLTSCANNNNYVCIPSLPPKGSICEGGTKIISIEEEAECSGEGFTGNRIIDNQNCEVYCTNGKIEIKGCVDIEGSVIPSELEELDEESKCAWYEQEYTKQEKDYGSFYWRVWTFQEPKIIETQDCKIANWIYLTSAIGVILILGTITILTLRKPKRKRRR